MRVVLLSLNAMEIHSFLFVLLEFVSARGQFIFTDFFFWQPDCVSLCVCFSVGFLLLLVVLCLFCTYLQNLSKLTRLENAQLGVPRSPLWFHTTRFGIVQLFFFSFCNFFSTLVPCIV
uniref:(northern house mosquito) hypothetical protein n=1 Tax=Culex pipiens TaxID=7175 RepID=A0A8D8FVU2_CULPI